ncbi:MAG TPA: biotin-dependent carboxyltransferase family protein [Chloroflexota bacterium]|nr:biotin-dependent carboxyltransferase family protein [Chloroflexota bacterium]
MTGPVLEVIEPGLLTAVQDGGRRGYEALGIPRGGALDTLAFTWANRLAGNPPDAAVLETVLLGPTLVASDDCWLATAGAEDVTLDGRSRPAWSGFFVPSGGRVAVKATAGARAYLAVHGGIAVEPVLGSRSTNLEARFGGFEGRGLRRGDCVPVGEVTDLPGGPHDILRHPAPAASHVPMTVRVVVGPDERLFSGGGLAQFLATTYMVSPQSNHMGVRLQGTPITAPAGNRLSQPMPVGGIQVPPDGQPIVLLAGRGTIGGYPLVATVISADLRLPAQARPGDAIRFAAVTVEEAQGIARAAAEDLAYGKPIAGRLRQEGR